MTVEEDTSPKMWHKQQELVLKQWGETCSCYRWLHYKSYSKFKKLSLNFSLPIIIISTVTGTASFAHQTFPPSWRSYVPLVIGAANLFGGILSTIQQFLKVNELLEAHRSSSIQYGKLTRLIKLELSLPVSDRTYGGKEMLELCKLEYDRLIEQSPSIQGDILKLFENEFPENTDMKEHLDFHRPEILSINPIKPFDGTSENVVIQEVSSKLKKLKRFEHPPETSNAEITVEVSS
jgi:hypothetical protein